MTNVFGSLTETKSSTECSKPSLIRGGSNLPTIHKTMEKIQLSDGRVKSFITSENDSWKFYLCDTYEEAQSLHMTLTEIGNHCEIDDNSRGWFVRVKK